MVRLKVNTLSNFNKYFILSNNKSIKQKLATQK